MKKTFVWLYCDLGMTGDYDSLYAWLDRQGAKECGEGLAAFSYSFRKDLVREITGDLRKHIKITPKTRIYLVRPEGGKTLGKFIFGSRRRAPWSGYAVTGEVTEDSVDA